MYASYPAPSTPPLQVVSDSNVVMLYMVSLLSVMLYLRSQGIRFDPVNVMVTLFNSASSVDVAEVSEGIKKGEEYDCSIPEMVHPSDAIHSDVFALLPSPLGGVLMVRFEFTHTMFRRDEGNFEILGLLFSKDVSVITREALELILTAP